MLCPLAFTAGSRKTGQMTTRMMTLYKQEGFVLVGYAPFIMSGDIPNLPVVSGNVINR